MTNVLEQLQGKALTAVCRAVHTEFSAAAEKLFAAEYDPLDLSAEADFTRDASVFKALVRELDKRLAAVILQVPMRPVPLFRTFGS